MPTSIEILKAGNVKIQASWMGTVTKPIFQHFKVINEFVSKGIDRPSRQLLQKPND